MLVLTRKKNQKVLFPNIGITVEVVDVSGKTARLAIDAPKEIRIIRDELEDKVARPSFDSESVELQRNLDAANLAVHLAKNQLRSGATEYAQRALEQALDCLEALDSILRDELEQIESGETLISAHFKGKRLKGNKARKSSEQLLVNEASSGYQVKRKPEIAILGGSSLERTQVVTLLMEYKTERDSKLAQQIKPSTVSECDFLQFKCGLELVDHVRANKQPAAVIEIQNRDSNRELKVASDEPPVALPISMPSSLRRIAEPIKLAGLNIDLWTAT